MLLNGASGIAVGLATEMPEPQPARGGRCRRWRLIRNDKLTDDELFALLPGARLPRRRPDHQPAPPTSATPTASGRGSLKLRARWKIEDLARGQWQLVVTELPPGTSAQKVLEEIEELTNPKVKAGKKALSAPSRCSSRPRVLAVLDAVRDESSKDAPVRLVFEPHSRTRRAARADHHAAGAHQPGKQRADQPDHGRAATAGRRRRACARCSVEWIAFRQATVQRRTRHRLDKVLDRIHVLEGRQLVLLNIDEVIRIIRNADEPKPALIERFSLERAPGRGHPRHPAAPAGAAGGDQDRAGAEGACATTQTKLEDILGSPAALKRTLIKEIEADAKQHGDERRTLIQDEKRAVARRRASSTSR